MKKLKRNSTWLSLVINVSPTDMSSKFFPWIIRPLYRSSQFHASSWPIYPCMFENVYQNFLNFPKKFWTSIPDWQENSNFNYFLDPCAEEVGIVQIGADQGGRRLDRWAYAAASLAGWRRVTQWFCVMDDGPCRLPWRTTPFAPVWGWSIAECTQNTGMNYVTQERHGLLL